MSLGHLTEQQLPQHHRRCCCRQTSLHCSKRTRQTPDGSPRIMSTHVTRQFGDLSGVTRCNYGDVALA